MRKAIPEQRREHNRKYYAANREAQYARVKARSARYREELVGAVRAYLRNHPCVDCGESDIRVLEFDHVRGTKLLAVSQLIKNSRKLSVVMDEIAKCDVRCANCHKKKTCSDQGWWKGT